ncbi:MAG: HlyD family type I secretion periplasmic adaptor subunit [Rhodobacteraceae bacterium]|nr:MAG: HlyD family type I secretion periplasmic adaptor subunit [Paracoccaceae bacterium]
MGQKRDLETLAREMQGRQSWRGSLLLAVILLFFLTAGVWAARTEIDDVTRAEGRIVPSSDIQIIQATEPGILQALFVAEGDIVEQGDVLMELDGIQLSSQLDQEQQRAYGLMARIERLQAEIDGVDLDFSPILIAQAPAVTRSEAALYHARRDELAAEIEILERQRGQRLEQYAEAVADLDAARETLEILAEERAMMEPLVRRRVEPETTLLELRRRESEWRGREIRARAGLARMQGALEEIDDQIRALRARQRSAALSDLALSTAELAALEPSLPALRDRAERAAIRAPMRGVVNRIHRTTLGALARPGEDLLEIVPLDDTLLVEAYVRPADIAFVYPGQPVRVKVTAYDFARYGSLSGEIIRIGANAVSRSERDVEEFFMVQIRTEDSFLDADGLIVEVMPGMVTEVDMLSGRKTVLQYLTTPVVRVKDRAFRE